MRVQRREMANDKHRSGMQRAVESAQATIFTGGWGARLAYQIGLQGRVRRRLHDFIISSASQPAPPLRLGFVSDLHAGPLTHAEVMRSAFEALAASSPDLILLGGDYVSFRAEDIDIVCEQVQKLRPPQGCYAVLGNHDLWTDAALITSKLKAAGVGVLVNESVRLAPPHDAVFICGLDDPSAGSPDLARTFAETEGTRILLMHSPAGIRLLRDHRVDLALTGHTHGGQIALPGGVPIVMPSGKVARRYAHGRFRLPNGHGELLVSKGVGCTGLPARLFAASEVHLCTINWPGH